MEAANHNLTSCQAECSALSRQLEDAILVDKAYPVEGKNEKARKAAEDKMLAVNEENNLLRSQLGQMTNSLEKSIQNEERLVSNFFIINLRTIHLIVHCSNTYFVALIFYL